MRITIDIDDTKLLEIQRLTKIRKKSPAVSHALDVYLHEMKKLRLLSRVRENQTDYPISNDTLEELSEYDSD